MLGLWGIIVLAPVMHEHDRAGAANPRSAGSRCSPARRPPVGLLTAIVILTIMAVPIVSAVTREVFETVPDELKEGALALGATRWEMVRMVILPYARSGIVGAMHPRARAARSARRSRSRS